MDRGGILVGLFVIGYIAFEAYGVHTQRHLMEPGYIHAQYAAAEQAMLRCGEAGPGTRKQFDHNLAVMERRAIAELLESGDYSNEEAAAAEVAARAAERRAEVDALAESAGCEDKQLWTLVKTYEQRARLNLQ
ncbi:MAG TPA: hypothetical protein DD491_07730 [Halieaceae bacterium]|nr:hypothetical protein [Halieaceae bacterium]|tara:strand:+ start:410 stop:808 length:399 start_codon:yes stop_codon:yes gene_type:complete